jgi:hypothetical protein
VSDRVRRFGGALGATIPSARDDARKPRAKPRSRVGQERRFEGERVLVSGEARGHRRGHRRRGRLVRRLRREGHVRVQENRANGKNAGTPNTEARHPFVQKLSVDSRGGRRAILLNKATPATPPPRRCLLARGGCGTPIRVIHQRRRFRELSTRFIVFVSTRTELSKMRLNERVGARRTLSRADAGRTAHSRAARRRRGRAVSLDILVRAPPIPV